MTHLQIALITNVLRTRAHPTFGEEVALRRLRAKIVRHLTAADIAQALEAVQ